MMEKKMPAFPSLEIIVPRRLSSAAAGHGGSPCCLPANDNIRETLGILSEI